MSEPWYAEGLPFKCTGCGKCCTGSPGYVWISEAEIEEMAQFLNISVAEFVRKYTRRVGSRLSLLESKTTYDCVFLRDKQCLVYKARPTQCKTYPFWPQNLSSKESWEETAKTCEGIDNQAPSTPLAEIESQKLIQIKRNKN